MILLGVFGEEFSTSFGKREMEKRVHGVYTYGFLSIFWSLIVFICIALYRGVFTFTFDSLPWFILFILAETAQVYSTIHAVKYSSRSTFGFLMILTIPLLLAVDLFIGYQFLLKELAGISLIVLSLILLFLNHGLEKRGLGYVLFSATNATLTLSLYKYLITHHNSVEANHIVSIPFFLAFLFVMAKRQDGENPVSFLFRPKYLFQAVVRGLGMALVGFGFYFVHASIALAIKRAGTILATIVSGGWYFGEKHLLVKIFSFGLLLVGVWMLIY